MRGPRSESTIHPRISLFICPNRHKVKISSVKISKSEKLMSFYVNGAGRPTICTFMISGAQRYSRLTNTLNPEIDPEDLVEAQRVHYKSFDGLDIPAIVYKPHQVDHSNKGPAMVWVHGGPGGQSTIHYDPLVSISGEPRICAHSRK